MPQEEELGKDLFATLLSSTETPLPIAKPLPLTMEDVRRFSGYDFEVLVAAIEKRSGKKVILTPQSGDSGIDVISLTGRELRLIQCKHTQWNGKVDADVVAEVITALDGYRAKYLRQFGQRVNFCAALMTNGEFTKSARTKARDGVEILNGDDLQKMLLTTQITQRDISEMRDARCSSMRDLPTALAALLG